MCLADDIEWPHLIKITEGYSGADISNVCREAAMMPMRKKLNSGGFDIGNLANIQKMQEEIDVPLTMADFNDAIKNIGRSVSGDQLKQYEEWMATFGSV